MAALFSAAICAGENRAAGKWNCMIEPEIGQQTAWTLLVREDGDKLAGVLTDNEIQLPLSELKVEENDFSFRFHINAKPYTFKGKIDGAKLEGKYKGEEASGRLRCEKAAT